MNEITVADCERAQLAWFTDLAAVAGGRVWQDDELTWIWTPANQHLTLAFPRRLTFDAVRRGVEQAGRDDVHTVGAWLALDVDAGPLVAAGFEQGWAPWWMTAQLDAIGPADDPRVVLEQDTPEYDDPSDLAQLAVARIQPPRAWHAAARVDGRLAGHAWSHRGGEVAGIFNMAVWPRFRRRGLGTALMRAICAPAAAAGARHAILNATPEGEQLYRTLGFRRIGDGITYWLHRN